MTRSPVLPFVRLEIQQPNFTWVDMTADLVHLEFARGNLPDGITDTLEIGDLSATLRGPAFAPATNPLIRPRVPLRVRVHDGNDWLTAWEGSTGVPVTTYADKGTPVTTLPGIDVVGVAGESKSPRSIIEGTLDTRMTRSMIGRSGDVPVAHTLIGSDEPGRNPAPFTYEAPGVTKLDKWKIIRDSFSAWMWSRRERATNIYTAPLRINVRGPANPPTTTPAVTLTDNAAEAGYRYTDLRISHDAGTHINAVNFRLLVASGSVPAGDHGTYVDSGSAATWPRREHTLEVTDVDGATLEVAAQRAMRRYPLPSVIVRAVSFNVLKDRTILTPDRIYQAVRVKHAPTSHNAVYLIARERHVIGRDSWHVTYDLRTLPTTRSITITKD